MALAALIKLPRVASSGCQNIQAWLMRLLSMKFFFFLVGAGMVNAFTRYQHSLLYALYRLVWAPHSGGC